MSFNKGSIDGRMIDVIKMEDYIKDRSIVNSGFVGIQVGGLVYPIRKQTEDKPGIYFSPRGTIAWLKKPNEEEKDLYSSSNIIDFRSSNTKEMIEKCNALSALEQQILTDVDNVFKPVIGEEDSPEMALFKEAISKKECDFDKDENRFDKNFNNDKRLLAKSNSTLEKIKSIGSKLDMKITLRIEDKNPDVPNPMGVVLERVLNDEE